NARADVAGDAERRARILTRRVESVRTELHRNGIAPVAIGEWPGPAPGGVQTYPPGELQAKQMVVVAHYGPAAGAAARAVLEGLRCGAPTTLILRSAEGASRRMVQLATSSVRSGASFETPVSGSSGRGRQVGAD
ncbi:MAG TPA: hypothetical protein VIZ19_07810, partial [Roseiarcus sp.]